MMTLQPRVAIGVPIFNRAQQVRRALESILAQSFHDFRIVAVDDCSTDETPTILECLAAQDPRLVYIRNKRRVGYTVNARATYNLCRQKYPSIEFFAWGSDHDQWHPQWLELLVKRLDETPDAAMACSWNYHIDDNGDILTSNKFPQMAERAAGGSAIDRVRFAAHRIRAGDFIYGLIRVAALEHTSGLRRVLEPDRLLLAELSAVGRISIVPAFLWSRRRSDRASHERQRRNSFPGRAPLYTHLPVVLQHGLVLAEDYVFRRLARPKISTIVGWKLAYSYLQERYRLNQRRHRYQEAKLAEQRQREEAKKEEQRQREEAKKEEHRQREDAKNVEQRRREDAKRGYELEKRRLLEEEQRIKEEKQRTLEEAAALKTRLREAARDLREKRHALDAALEAAAEKARLHKKARQQIKKS